jgi:oligopeptide/dipeptide ABC transporter ATP-binding protein
MYAGQQMEVAPTRSFFTRPSHPYTHKLLESLPHPRRELTDNPGEVPGLILPPPGCRFYPRCEHAQDRCRQTPPGETQVAENHIVRCYYPLNAARE